MHVEVPKECQHKANKHELKHELLTADQGIDEADRKHDRDAEQQNSRQRGQQPHQ